ncbi:2-amino-4-hydroxy-6-hydroxymethyldihydropteridine diphosphokinase [Alteromonadaceae bacterium BrNp21-10]|nr:2-amino-4-hydroxy-6-hydroxymethyldihydropteridine diphosphokinase [Alteromonadaceae bacterium BrNp21-10]
MITVYIGLGSNLSQPVDQLQQALVAIDQHPQIQLLNTSSFYSSCPMGPQDQPDYVNAVAAIQTTLAPLALLDALQAIENQQGRQRIDGRWTARTLDLDILLFGNQEINNPRLQVPHYGLAQREFVLYPLAEIAPDLIIPPGQSLQTLVAACAPNGLTKLTL